MQIVLVDQTNVFLTVGRHLSDPYTVSRFLNPPWTAALLLPLSIMPPSLAILLQLIATCYLISAIMRRHGASTKQVALCLLSPFAVTQIFQLNIDWLVYCGLLAAPSCSAIFLLIKPQIALGSLVAYTRRQWIAFLCGLIILLLISALLWPGWAVKMLNGWLSAIPHEDNVAPLAYLPIWLSFAAGLALFIVAFRKHDQPLALLGWLFFVLYLPFYSLLIYYAMLILRWPLLAVIIFICTWVIYSGVVLLWMI